MSLRKITFTGSNVMAKDDAAWRHSIVNKCGVLKGVGNECSITLVGNKFVWSSGVYCIFGRLIEVEEGTTSQFGTVSSNPYGTIYLRIEVSGTESTASFISSWGAYSYPNITNKQYDYTANEFTYYLKLANIKYENGAFQLISVFDNLIYPSVDEQTFEDTLDDIRKTIRNAGTDINDNSQQIHNINSKLTSFNDNFYVKIAKGQKVIFDASVFNSSYEVNVEVLDQNTGTNDSYIGLGRYKGSVSYKIDLSTDAFSQIIKRPGYSYWGFVYDTAQRSGTSTNPVIYKPQRYLYEQYAYLEVYNGTYRSNSEDIIVKISVTKTDKSSNVVDGVFTY